MITSGGTAALNAHSCSQDEPYRLIPQPPPPVVDILGYRPKIATTDPMIISSIYITSLYWLMFVLVCNIVIYTCNELIDTTSTNVYIHEVSCVREILLILQMSTTSI